MIRVIKFTLSSKERRKKQAVKDLDIVPQRGLFKFKTGGDLINFEYNLKKCFSEVFSDGCNVSTTLHNSKEYNPCLDCDCVGCCNGDPKL